jgi:TolA-binding protein
MGNRLAVVAGVLAVVLALGVAYLWTRLGSEAAIARAETEAKMLREQRDSILTIVARNDSLQRELGVVRRGLEAEADELRERIASLEVNRVETQLTVRRLRRSDALQARFASTFPEVAASNWGVTEVLDEEEGVGIEYLMVPLWFSETFMIDHENSEAYQAQVESFASLTGVQDRVIHLQDSVFVLERQSRDAYQTGYDNAFALYQNLNREHISLLRQPRISLGIPGGIMTAAGTFGLGILLGATAP